MRTIRRTVSVAVIGLVALGAAACDNGDDGGAGDVDTSTMAPVVASTSAPPPPDTAPPATTPPSPPPAKTEPASTATTTPPSTTIDEEALKSQIAEDFIAALDRLRQLTEQPPSTGIEQHVSQIAAPGTYQDEIVGYVSGLAEAGQRVVLGDPPVFEVTVEQVTLVDSGSADVQFCWTQNGQVVEPGAGPGGSDRIVTPGALTAVRDRERVVLTDQGWLQESSDGRAIEIFEGSDSCRAP